MEELGTVLGGRVLFGKPMASSIDELEGQGLGQREKGFSRPAVESADKGASDHRKTERTHAFSVDVEDYFHDETFRHLMPSSEWDDLDQRVEPSTERILEMLDEFSVVGTFFVLGWVAERNPDLVKRIKAAGHEVAIHGYDHRPVTVLSPSDFRTDVRRSKTIVEDIIGEPVIGYRAPTFSIVEETYWALDILAEEGFLYDSSVFPIVHDRYGIPDADRYPHAVATTAGDLVEFPISTFRLAGRNVPFIGGGYLRLLPMSFVRWGMRRMARDEGLPMVLYVHPWEVDPGQPVLPVKLPSRLRHYGGLSRVESRLRSLLSELRFGPVREVLGL